VSLISAADPALEIPLLQYLSWSGNDGRLDLGI